MNSNQTYCLVKTSQSEAINTLAWELLVKEGQKLSNSLTEDVGGFSLMPSYSYKQLRKITRNLLKKNHIKKQGQQTEALQW